MKEGKAVHEQQLVISIRQGDQAALHQVYKTHWPMVLRMVQMNSGNEADAKDIYQETVLVLYDNICDENFELLSKLKTYVYAIGRRLWLKHLRDTKSVDEQRLQSEWHEDVEHQLDQHDKKNSQQQVVNESMNGLGEPCKTILTDFFYGGYTMDEIAEKMGYTNAANAKNQKYKCLQRLKKMVKAKLL